MIYYNFAQLFKSSGKSLRKLEKEIGIGYVTLHKLSKASTLNDYVVCTDSLDKICRFFQIPLDAVVRYESDGKIKDVEKMWPAPQKAEAPKRQTRPSRSGKRSS
jgi:DNA-binding Xre family transcriptional regulator